MWDESSPRRTPLTSLLAVRTSRPLLNALGVLALAISSVRVAVLDSYINSGLFTALQELDAAAFTRYIGIFAVQLVGFVTQALSPSTRRALVIRWRVWLNDQS